MADAREYIIAFVGGRIRVMDCQAKRGRAADTLVSAYPERGFARDFHYRDVVLRLRRHGLEVCLDQLLRNLQYSK